MGSIGAWVLTAGEPEYQGSRLVAALQAQGSGSTSPAASPSDERPTRIDRAPVRTLAKAPYAAYSAVVVDPKREEIVAQDEGRTNILIYDRLANTPPGAAVAEPKRTIGGPLKKISTNCGVYVDPANGDIYSVSGDVQTTLTIFSREAKGNVPPNRQLDTPLRSFGIAADEQSQEMFLTIQHPPAVVVWRKTAQGKESPIRILEGDKTQLADAQGIALDTKNQLLYVSNRGATSAIKPGMEFSGIPVAGEGEARTWLSPDNWFDSYWERYVPGSGRFASPSITVYPLKASGNTPPLRIIQGPQTQLNWPTHIHVDVEHQELFATDPTGDSVQVFRATDSGDVAPIRVLKGPKTKLSHPFGVFVDEANQELVVANSNNHAITVYRRTAEGDPPPIRTIRSAPEGTKSLMVGSIGSLGYDSKRNEILAPN